MRLFRSLILVAICASTLTIPPLASAQIKSLPSVAAENCTIEPIAIPQLGEIGDLTQATSTPAPIDRAEASPADPEITAAVIELVVQSIACANAGDELRMLACFSDEWIQARFNGYDLVFYERFLTAAAISTPSVLDSQISLIAIEVVGVRADGRVLIEIETEVGTVSSRSLLLLVEQSGAWRIDASEPTV